MRAPTSLLTAVLQCLVPVSRCNVKPGFISACLLLMSTKMPCVPERKTLVVEKAFGTDCQALYAGIYTARFALNGHLMSYWEGQEAWRGLCWHPEIWVSDHHVLMRAEEDKVDISQMYNNCVIICTLFCGKGLWGFLCCEILLGFSLPFFCAWRKYITFKIIAEWNFTFPVK